MIRITAEEFWRSYRDGVRKRGSLDSLKNSRSWTEVAIDSAKAICLEAGLKIGNELYLDVMGYEQRQSGVNFNWDLRVAFEHENTKNWQDELCKLCHVVADLRVLVGYFTMREGIRDLLQQRIDQMGERMTRVARSEWLFILGPDDSRRNPTPWTAFSIGDGRRLAELPDDKPFIPFIEFSRTG